MADQIDEVKAKVSIVELVSEYVKLTKAGRNFKGLCPFHSEKTPSFVVNPELQIYKCFGCQEGGDVFSFVQKMEGVEFGEALTGLAKRVGIVLTGYKPSKSEEIKERLISVNTLAAEAYMWLLRQHKSGEVARKYLKDRGITDEAIDKFRLGYAVDQWDFVEKFLVEKKKFSWDEVERAGLTATGKKYDRFRGRLMFPLSNARGVVVGFAGRVMPGQEDRGGKYINTSETELYHKGELLYALDVNKGVIKEAKSVVVVEGEIDAIASWQAGVKNVVAIKGSALTEKQVELLKRYAEVVILALDADLAGDAAARRGIDIAHKAGLIIKIVNSKSEILNPKQYKDPGEWAMNDPEGWRKAVVEAIPIFDFYLLSAVARYGLSAEGKGRISRELVPIWAGIDDEIVKAHYIQLLAKTLGVGEEDVRAQIGKNSNSKLPISKQNSNINNSPNKTKRREIVEEYVVGLALRNDKIDELIKPPVSDWITTAFWKRVIDQLKSDNGKLTIKERIENLPEELRQKVGDLILLDDDFSDKEWTKALAELEKEDIREKKSKLDPDSDLPKIRDLDARLKDLT